MKLTNCDNCSKAFKDEKDSVKFTSKIPKADKLVGDVLREIMFKQNPVAPFTPMRKRHDESRAICQSCVSKLRTLDNAFQAFFPSAGVNSYVRRKMDMRIDDSFEDIADSEHETPPQPPQPKPKKVKKAPAIRKEHAALLRKEIRKFAAHSQLLHGNLKTKGDIPSWDRVDIELKLLAPNVRRVILALSGRVLDTLTPKIGTALSIFANSANIFANRFQCCISFLLARTRASKQIYQLLNEFGICTSYNTLLKSMDRISATYDDAVHEMRQEILDKLVTYERESEASRNDGKGAKRKLDFGELSELNTFSLCMDNLNRRIVPSQTSTQRQVKQLNIVTVLAFRNRVPFNLNDLAVLRKPSEVPFTAFTLTNQDVELVKSTMVYKVKEFLENYMTYFANVTGRSHPPIHAYQRQVSKKSQIVNLGAINEDEGTIDGTVEILRNLKKYSIQRIDGTKFPIIIYGDGLTNRRCFEARCLTAITPHEDKKCDDFDQGPGWFHAEMIQLSLDMNIFFGKGVTTSPGTMPQLRDKFLFNRVLKDTKKCFNATKRFYRFSTAAYVLGMACNILKVQSIDTPSAEETPIEELHLLLQHTAEQIVELNWHMIERSSLQKKYCNCQKTEEESEIIGLSFIGCDNLECKMHLWYHKECILSSQKPGVEDIIEIEPSNFEPEDGADADEEMDPVDPSEAELEEEGDYHFREMKDYDEMEEEIDKELIYKSSNKKWYCCMSCKKEADDKVFGYTRGLIFTGLLQESFRESIRQGDAERIVALGKLHMMRYSHRHHPTYRGVMARFLAAIGGAAAAHVQHDLKFNNFINVVGKPGHNLPVDLVNEFANNIFAQLIIGCHGNLTTSNLERRTRSVGFLMEFVEMVRTELARDKQIGRTTKQTEAWRVDLSDCVELLLKQDNLFKISTAPRHHNGFKDFKMDDFYASDIGKYRRIIKILVNRMENLKDAENVVSKA